MVCESGCGVCADCVEEKSAGASVEHSPRPSLIPLEVKSCHDWVTISFEKWSPDLKLLVEKSLLERGFFTTQQLSSFQDIDIEEIAMELEMKDFTAKLFLAKVAALAACVPPSPPTAAPVFTATAGHAYLGSLDKHDPRWEDDSVRAACKECDAEFGLLRRRHHCRTCGVIVCHECSGHPAALNSGGDRGNQLDDNIHCKSCILAAKKAETLCKNEAKLASLVSEFSVNEAGLPRKSLIESLVMLGPALFKNSEHQMVVGCLHEWVLAMPQIL